MADNFFLALPRDVREICTKPTDHDFYDYVFSNWPGFHSFNEDTTKTLTFGWVDKEEKATNEVYILSDLVVSAESAVAKPHLSILPVELYNLLITAVVLHQLSHAFTKFWFKEVVTPVAIRNQKYVEWLVEREIMGGHVAVEWDNPRDFGNLDVINRVLLLRGTQSWAIGVNVAKSILASLQGTTLVRPAVQNESKLPIN